MNMSWIIYSSSSFHSISILAWQEHHERYLKTMHILREKIRIDIHKVAWDKSVSVERLEQTGCTKKINFEFKTLSWVWKLNKGKVFFTFGAKWIKAASP